MSSELLKNLLWEFGKLIGIPDLAPDSDNYCCLSVDESIMLHIKLEETTDYVTFLVQVGTFDDTQKEVLYSLLLAANSNPETELPFTLAKAVDENTITLTYKEFIRFMDFPRFEAIVKQIIESSEVWIQKVADCVKGDLPVDASRTSSQTPENEASHMMGMRV